MGSSIYEKLHLLNSSMADVCFNHKTPFFDRWRRLLFESYKLANAIKIGKNQFCVVVWKASALKCLINENKFGKS